MSATFKARERVEPLYLNNPADHRPPPGLGLPQQTSSSFPIADSYYMNHTSSYPLTSPIANSGLTLSTSSSSNSEVSSEVSSRRSSESSVSTSPSLNRIPPWEHPRQPNSQNYAYNLPCEFAIVGCEVQFAPQQFESWLSHTISHFVPCTPPPKAICSFCDRHDSVFENYRDPLANWRRRMLHIGAHYASGMQYEQLRPDYFIINYMWQNGLLSARQYEQATNYTERKHVSGLVPVGYKTEEMRRKEGRSLEQRYNLDHEKRQIKRAKRTSRGKGKEARQGS